MTYSEAFAKIAKSHYTVRLRILYFYFSVYCKKSSLVATYTIVAGPARNHPFTRLDHTLTSFHCKLQLCFRCSPRVFSLARARNPKKSNGIKVILVHRLVHRFVHRFRRFARSNGTRGALFEVSVTLLGILPLCCEAAAVPIASQPQRQTQHPDQQ